MAEEGERGDEEHAREVESTGRVRGGFSRERLSRLQPLLTERDLQRKERGSE